MAVKEKKTIDPRTQPGAYVKTPGGLRAYVVGLDPKDSDASGTGKPERVIIEYEVKGMGTDNYLIRSLTLIQAAPETDPPQAAKPKKGAARKVKKQSEELQPIDLTASDIDGNELKEGDRVIIAEVGGMSKTWLNATAVITEINDDGSLCRIRMEHSPNVHPYWGTQKLRKQVAEIVEINPLDFLATEINQLHAECEGAIVVAQKAEQSALLSAIECGGKLLEAKARCRAEGKKWEQWRDENLGIPSSTATLYQRIYSNREQLEELGITSVRQANEALKSDRKIAESKSAALQQAEGIASSRKVSLANPQPVADLPESEETPIVSSEHLETTPSISEEAPSICPDYGEGVSEEVAQSLMDAGVMPCKPSITPEEFNCEMQRSGLVAQDIRIINPKLKRCEFISNNRLIKGTVSGVLFDWKRMSVAAILIDYGDGKQIQVPASYVWLIDEGDSKSNDQPINRFALIDEIEAKGWYWNANRTFCNEPTDYSYWAHITTPDRKQSFFAKEYEALEDALDNCIEQAKEAGVWEKGS